MPRRLLRLPHRLLQGLLLAVAAGLLLFVGLTRTQVGRDALRVELEQQFDAEFAGALTIGTLTGNLVSTLYASDIALVDAEGGVVVTVDSVVARLRWRDLLRRDVTIRSLTLFRPHVMLTYTADSTWSLADALRRPDRQRSGAPWSFSSASIQVVDGRLTTATEGPTPPSAAAGWVFDYSQAAATDIQLDAAVEWSAAVRQLDLIEATATSISPALPIEHLRGQWIRTDSLDLFNEWSLALGRTRLEGEGVRPRIAADSAGASAMPPAGELRIRESHLHFDELRRVVPRLPLRDSLTVAFEAEGAPDAFAVRLQKLARGQTELAGKATVRGLPTALRVDAQLEAAPLRLADVDAVLPDTLPEPWRSLPAIRGDLTLAGSADDLANDVIPFQLSADLSARASFGELSVTARTERDAASVWRLESTGRFARLDLAPLIQPVDSTHLAGTISIESEGASWAEATGDATVRLRPSYAYGVSLDTLQFLVGAEPDRFTVRALADAGAEHLALLGTGTRGAQPQIDLSAAVRNLDLRRALSEMDHALSLSGRITYAGPLGRLDDAAASLGLEGATLRVADDTTVRVLPSFSQTVQLRPAQASGPRLALDGDVASGQLAGALTWDAVHAFVAAWKPAAEQAIARQRALTRTEPATRPQYAIPEAPEQAVDVQLDATLYRPDVIAAFLGPDPVDAQPVRARLTLNAEGAAMQTAGSVTTDRWASGTLGLTNAALTWTLGASLDQPLERSLEGRLDLKADTIAAGTRLPDVEATIAWENRRATYELTAGKRGLVGPLALAGTVQLHSEERVLSIDKASLDVGSYRWRAEPADLVAYSDALVVPQLRFVAEDSAATRQAITVRGTLSATPTDTLSVAVRRLDLSQLASLLPLRQPLSGRLDGDLSLVNVGAPEVAGQLVVDTLGFGGYTVGTLTASSRFSPDTPDVRVRADVRPLRIDASRVGSELALTGRVQLPGPDRPDGLLDLVLGAEHVEPFFFELIFAGVLDAVRGSIRGRATVDGTFSAPRFGGELALADASFRVPRFNLQMRGDGTARLSERGIRIDALRLTDKTGGTAAITGDVLFNDYAYFSLDMDGALDRFQIIDVAQANDLPFYGTLWASGNASLTGPLSQAVLRAPNATTSPESELFIPLVDEGAATDPGFLVFADSTGAFPDLDTLTERRNLLSRRPAGERPFLDGLEMDLNLFAPSGSTVHLVIDPLLGDVINAVGTGRVQLLRQEGAFSTYGRFDVDAGDYLFTASDVFVRRFQIEDGSIVWDGDPLNAQLDITAAYRTRASRTGLPAALAQRLRPLIPVVVWLEIDGRVAAPLVELRLAVDRTDRTGFEDDPLLTSILNQPDRTAEYATSVLLTNSFLLTTEGTENDILAGSAFNSVSQLVASQLNRYLNEVLPNVDVSLGVLGNEAVEDLDVTAGLALRLLDERLVIRGAGVYRGVRPEDPTQEQSLQGEFVVEVRLGPSVSVEVFYRREGDVLNESVLTNTTGAGLSYQTQFRSWRRLFGPADAVTEEKPDDQDAPADVPPTRR